MKDKPPDKRHLKVVPAIDPNSVPLVNLFSRPPSDEFAEGVLWGREPRRPCLRVIRGGDFAPEAERGAEGKPSTLQDNESHDPDGHAERGF